MKEECQNLYGLEQTKCVRVCMSIPCYEELYAHDEVSSGLCQVLNWLSYILREKICKIEVNLSLHESDSTELLIV